MLKEANLYVHISLRFFFDEKLKSNIRNYSLKENHNYTKKICCVIYGLKIYKTLCVLFTSGTLALAGEHGLYHSYNVFLMVTPASLKTLSSIY